MPNWTENDIKKQLNYAGTKGWLPIFEAAAANYGFCTELLLAIASRETNMRNIKGDFREGIYHGFGIMQVDIGTKPNFCETWTPETVQDSIMQGADILSEKRGALEPKGITDLRAIAAAYNTGATNVIRSVMVRPGGDPDRTTTGRDYGRDVLARMEVFAKLRGTNLTGPQIKGPA